MTYIITGLIMIFDQHRGLITERRRIKEFKGGTRAQARAFKVEYRTRQGRRFSSLEIELEGNAALSNPERGKAGR